MSTNDKPGASRVIEAVRAKHERKRQQTDDIASLEAALLADIANFDLSEAAKAVIDTPVTPFGIERPTPITYPSVAPAQAVQQQPARHQAIGDTQDVQAISTTNKSNLLRQLRVQAEQRQRELNAQLNERSIINEAIDQALKKFFFFLHDLVQQLNILKPAISRDYPINEQLVLSGLNWQEGFSDYRMQSHSEGALVEFVTFSAQLGGTQSLFTERDGTVVSRLRSQLFDLGLSFHCKESRNSRGYVERAQFEILSKLTLSARFSGDYDKGQIALEMCNIERLGPTRLVFSALAVNETLLDEFGKLVLGLPNRFRELCRLN